MSETPAPSAPSAETAPASAPNSSPTAEASAAPNDGAKAPEVETKAFSKGYNEAKAKFGSKITELETQLAKLQNTGKTADELRADLEKTQATYKAELSAREERLGAYEATLKADLDIRLSKLDQIDREILEESAGDDPLKMMNLLPKFEARSVAKRPTQGGLKTANDGSGVDLAAYDKAISAADRVTLQKMRKEHGAALDEALQRRGKK